MLAVTKKEILLCNSPKFYTALQGRSANLSQDTSPIKIPRQRCDPSILMTYLQSRDFDKILRAFALAKYLRALDFDKVPAQENVGVTYAHHENPRHLWIAIHLVARGFTTMTRTFEAALI
jgi:hypothetical protein